MVEGWPSGYVTFLFTDMKNSTGIALQVGDKNYMAGLYEPQEKAFAELVKDAGGRIFNDTGDGYVAVFEHADEALQVAIAFQQTTQGIPPLETGERVQMRIGIHTSLDHLTPTVDETGKATRYGTGQISLASRVMGIAWEEQILLSPSALAALKDRPDPRQLKAWEGRFLKSLDEPWDITELAYDGVWRKEPGTRFAPTWYVGEKNRYIPRPALEDDLIGRFRDKVAENACLVTLQGEGGMGKTRLGIQVATRVCGFYKDSVYFVSLAHAGRGPELARSLAETVDTTPTLFTDEQLLNALAREIGAALDPTEKNPTPAWVEAALLTTESLLVLDNFESVACEGVREWLAGLAMRAPKLYLLLTTRETHGIGGLGNPYRLERGMTSEEAHALFEARARTNFGITNAGEVWHPHTPSIETIVRLTDGVPLLVEYAAAWAVVEDQQSTAKGLTEALSGPTPAIAKQMGIPDEHVVPDDAITQRRHHQFACTLNWSYNLLGQHYGPQAQRCFLVCALFEEEFDAGVVEEIYGEGFQRRYLNALPQCSLLTRREVDGFAIYSMHRRTRAYALAQFDNRNTEEKEVLRDRYTDCFTQMAITEGNRSGAGVTAEVSGAAKVRLAQYASDIECVLLNYAAAHNSQAASMVSALSNYIAISSRRIRREILEQVATSSQQNSSGIGYANILYTQGRMAMQIGDNAEASSKYLEALPIFRKAQSPLGEANCLRSMGDIAFYTGDNAEASSKYLEALPIFREAQDPLGEANCLKSMGNIAFYTGDNAEASSKYLEALPIFRKAQSPLGEANCLKSMGDIAFYTGDNAEATSKYMEALPIFRKAQEPLGEANCLQSMGDIAFRIGNNAEATSKYMEALPIFRKAQEPLGEANCLQSMGDIAFYTGDNAEATSKYMEALPIYRKAQSPLGEANCLKSMGFLKIRMGNREDGLLEVKNTLLIYERLGDTYSMGATWYELMRYAESDQERAEYRENARRIWAESGQVELIERYLS